MKPSPYSPHRTIEVENICPWDEPQRYNLEVCYNDITDILTINDPRYGTKIDVRVEAIDDFIVAVKRVSKI